MEEDELLAARGRAPIADRRGVDTTRITTEMSQITGAGLSAGETIGPAVPDGGIELPRTRESGDMAATGGAIQSLWMNAVARTSSDGSPSQIAERVNNTRTLTSSSQDDGPANHRQSIIYSSEARNIPALVDSRSITNSSSQSTTVPRQTPPRTFLSAVMISPSDTSATLRNPINLSPTARSPQADPPTTIRIPLVLATDPATWASLPTEEQSQALLSSLQNLRSTLAARVESLSVEVERLRRRAEELESGIQGEGNERTDTGTPARRQGNDTARDTDGVTTREIQGPAIPMADAENNTVTPKGNGVCDVEEGKSERRARRLAAIRAKVDPAQLQRPVPPVSSDGSQLATDSDLVSRRHTWLPAVPGPAPRQDTITTRWPRITNRRDFERRVEERLFASGSSEAEGGGSPSPSSPAVNRPDILAGAELDRLRNLLERSAVERRQIRAEAERATQRRAAAADEGSTGPAVRDQGLTERGRRVQQTMQSTAMPSGGNASTARNGLAGGALPPRQTVWTSYTRYRDALLSGPVPDAVLPTGTLGSSTAADQIPPYPRMSRGGDALEPTISIETPVIVADAAGPLRRSDTGTGDGPGGGRAAGTDPRPPRSEMVQDIRAAARTQEQLSELTRIVASLRERLRTVVAAGNDRGRLASSSDRTGRRPSPPGLADREASPRRPTYPFVHSSSHPHHRPRIGPDPIAAVVNLDNHNSFDLNFDGNIIFRPIASREPDRELIARCLSMLPGGRDDTPSRWMRMTGTGSARPRRASASAGFWVRWVSEPERAGAAGVRHRHLDMSSLPRIVAYDFAVSPPDDEAFVRADEVEFHTPRTRLRRHVGPWMHSRVRIAPFESDPPIARWGTSSHVRQAVSSRGGLGYGDFMTFDLRARSVNITRAASSRRPATSRGLGASGSSTATTEPVLPSAADDPVAPAPLPPPIATSDASTDPDAWLLAFEPAIGQIRAHWRAHHRRQYSGESHPIERRPHAATRPIASAVDDAADMWSRDYMDADGMPLPVIPLLSTSILRGSDAERANGVRGIGNVEEEAGLRIDYV